MDATSNPSRTAIEVAIARRAFQLVYQPIVHLDTGDVKLPRDPVGYLSIFDYSS